MKDATEGQNDYKMSGLLSNATFIDKAVYHSGCITKYLLTRTPDTLKTLLLGVNMNGLIFDQSATLLHTM